MGIHWNVLDFNTFIVTALEFVAQLCTPPGNIDDMMNSALRKLAPGPGNWCTTRDLEHLQLYGLPASFRTLVFTAKAAKLRVVDQFFS